MSRDQSESVAKKILDFIIRNVKIVGASINSFNPEQSTVKILESLFERFAEVRCFMRQQTFAAIAKKTGLATDEVTFVLRPIDQATRTAGWLD